MSRFIQVRVSSGNSVRININHIIYYEPYQKASHSLSSTRIYITDDCIETETHITDIDRMIEELSA